MIKIEAKNGNTYTVTAEGSYSLGMYVRGISENGTAPAYASALYSYVLAAADYKSAQ